MNSEQKLWDFTLILKLSVSGYLWISLPHKSNNAQQNWIRKAINFVFSFVTHDHCLYPVLPHCSHLAFLLGHYLKKGRENEGVLPHHILHPEVIIICIFDNFLIALWTKFGGGRRASASWESISGGHWWCSLQCWQYWVATCINSHLGN